MREVASAALDGEADTVELAAWDAHRAGCPACARWAREVEALRRRVRVRAAEGAPAGFAATVTAGVTLPGDRLRRRLTALRVVLGALGAAQVALAVSALFDADMGMTMTLHGSHESTAWNAAVGVALLLVAVRSARSGGALTVVVPFVVALTALSAADVVDGSVGAARLVTHLGVVAGTAALWAVHRAGRGLPERPPVDAAAADPVPGSDGRAAEARALREWAARSTSGREVA